MQEKKQVRVVDLIDSGSTNMIHYVGDFGPFLALCGAKLEGVPCPGRNVECVVCAEMGS